MADHPRPIQLNESTVLYVDENLSDEQARQFLRESILAPGGGNAISPINTGRQPPTPTGNLTGLSFEQGQQIRGQRLAEAELGTQRRIEEEARVQAGTQQQLEGEKQRAQDIKLEGIRQKNDLEVQKQADIAAKNTAERGAVLGKEAETQKTSESIREKKETRELQQDPNLLTPQERESTARTDLIRAQIAQFPAAKKDAANKELLRFISSSISSGQFDVQEVMDMLKSDPLTRTILEEMGFDESQLGGTGGLRVKSFPDGAWYVDENGEKVRKVGQGAPETASEVGQGDKKSKTKTKPASGEERKGFIQSLLDKYFNFVRDFDTDPEGARFPTFVGTRKISDDQITEASEIVTSFTGGSRFYSIGQFDNARKLLKEAGERGQL